MFESEQSLVAVNLRRLVILRAVLIVGQCLLILLGVYWLHMELPLKPLLTVVAIYSVVDVLTLHQLRSGRDIGVRGFFLHVILDVVALWAMLYFSGGATNPFVSLLLLPLIIITTTMPRVYIWIMTGITMLAYSLLMVSYQPMPHAHMQHAGDFDLHIVGMWISFLVAAALIVTFLLRMAESIRERDHRLAAAREKMLQDESLVALGTVAAGAAHEISTPLATMAIVIGEIASYGDRIPELAEHTTLLRQQIERCKATLEQMSARAGRDLTAATQTLDNYLTGTISQWRNMRPGIEISTDIQGSVPAPEIAAQIALSQAIINLLNNAADASEHGLAMQASWDERTLTIDVYDQGPGLPVQREDLGELFFTTKGEGHGLGLYLARAVIARLGGTLELSNREGGGVCARLTVPLRALIRQGSNQR